VEPLTSTQTKQTAIKILYEEKLSKRKPHLHPQCLVATKNNRFLWLLAIYEIALLNLENVHALGNYWFLHRQRLANCL
jgi:hypothetical protein